MEVEPSPSLQGAIEMWHTGREEWSDLWLQARAVASGPGSGPGLLLLCFASAEAAASGKTDAALVVAERPFVQADASAEGFRIEAGAKMIYHCRTLDSHLRAELLAHCSVRPDLQQLRREFPREIGGRYWLGAVVGEGGYATVLDGVDIVTGERIACKESRASFNPAQKREIVLQAALKHEYVVGVRDVVYQPGEESDDGRVFIIMEMESGGEFFSAVAKSKGMEEIDVRHFCRQLLLGVAYCHSRQVCLNLWVKWCARTV